MNKGYSFFATTQDLRQMLAVVEADGPLQYILTGSFERPSLQRHERGADIRKLGIASGDQQIACDAFLVSEMGKVIKVRSARQTTGGTRHLVDQLENPDTVVLLPAGSFGNGVMIEGRVATASDSVQAKELLERFGRAIKRSWAKSGAVYVGPEADLKRQSGARLTISAQSPPEFDLWRQPRA